MFRPLRKSYKDLGALGNTCIEVSLAASPSKHYLVSIECAAIPTQVSDGVCGFIRQDKQYMAQVFGNFLVDR